LVIELMQERGSVFLKHLFLSMQMAATYRKAGVDGSERGGTRGAPGRIET